MVALQLTPTLSVNIKQPFLRPRLSDLNLLRLCKNDLRTSKKLPLSVCSSLPLSNLQEADQSLSLVHRNDQDVAAILFGNGPDSKLCPLTRRRSAGAIPLGANYRLIDAVVSNCINSNITKIYALTQFNSTSLNSHLTRAYSNVGLGNGGFLEVVAACQSPENQSWFQGNADAVRRFLWMLEDCPVTEFIILPGYHLYKMDYREILQLHRERQADITISALCSEKRHNRGFGILKLNSEDKVLQLMEKETDFPYVGTLEDSEYNKCTTFASMGIYVIRKDVMIKTLRENLPWANDFGSEVIPGAISLGMKVQAYLFDGYWENMRTIRAFYQANMESTKKEDIRYDFYDTESPLYTLARRLPPTKVTEAVIVDSAIGDACILNRCRIKRSVIGLRARIEDGAVIEHSIVMGSDIYQGDWLHSMDKKKSITPIGIGQGSLLRNAIVDKNARIGKRVMIINKDNIQEGSRENQGYFVRDGIVVISKSAIVPDDSIL